MRKLAVIAALILTALQLGAQSGKDISVKYNLDFLFHFDNREFSSSGDDITPSYTEHAAVFKPMLGVMVKQSDNVQHYLMGGVDLQHDMGEQSWKHTAKEAVLYYEADVLSDKGLFQGFAGIFPRRQLEGSYSEAFFSDSLLFNDRLLEGVLLKWKAGDFYAELGCDWMGKLGHERRERFQLISAGSWKATPALTLGWSGLFYHYACSEVAPGVVDNHLLEPWIKADAACIAPWFSELSLQGGFMLGYQRNRKIQDKPDIPLGGEFTLTARRKNLVFKNTSYFGDNLQAMYHVRDESGAIYGNNLYPGLPFYTGFYDRAELSWEPELVKYITLRLAARAHFSKEGFLGWQQLVSLRFNLDAFLGR
ncbi:MAG: hypothetical protein IJ151_03250 [Bacteroidales bacterium]|nr:hypothetical protein [Bacteroidales bacterium]